MRRALRWIGIGLVALVVLLLGFAVFLVGTTAGGRLALSIAEDLLPDDVSIEVGQFEGRLIDRVRLEGVRLRLPGLEADVEGIELDWKGLGIVRRRVHVRSLIVDGASVRLVADPAAGDSVEAEMEREEPEGPPLADLPVALSFDSVVVRNAGVTTPDSIRVTDAALRLTGSDPPAAGTVEDYRISGAARVEVPETLTADVVLAAGGSNESARLDSLVAETLEGRVTVRGDAGWWPSVGWEVELTADSLAPAGLLPDPEAWPGRISLRGSSRGEIDGDGRIALEAAIDTVYGELRGELLEGRVQARVAGPEIEIDAARLAWGPARVEAAGDAGETLALDFDAEIPDLGLVLPGAAGTITAGGRAEGPRDAPRLRASVTAAGLELEGASADSVTGEVDVDLAGPLQADLVARRLRVAGRDLDSAGFALSGRRDAHDLRLAASGPRADLALEATGALDEAGHWSGSLDTLALRADTIGSWSLESPAALVVGPGVEFERVCLASDPARVCAEGAFEETGFRLAAEIDSLRIERLQPLLPEGYEARAGVDAEIDLTSVAGGPITGTIDVRTTEGSFALPGTAAASRSAESDPGAVADPGEGADPAPARTDPADDRPTTFWFEPIVLAVSSSEEGARGEVNVRLTDDDGIPLVRLEGDFDSPFAIRSAADLAAIDDQPFSVRMAFDIDDMEPFAAYALPRWDAWGGFHVSLALDVDEAGNLEGSLTAAADSLSLRNTVRQQAYLLSAQPLRIEATVGPDGLAGTADLVLSSPEVGSLLEASGEFALPRLTSLDIDPAEQPVEGSLRLTVDDIYFVEAFFPEVTEMRGRFGLESQIGGTLDEITVDGEAHLADGYALIPLLGLELREMRLDATSSGDGEIRVDGRVLSGDGELTLTGHSEEYPSPEEPTVFEVRGERFRVIDTPEIRIDASPSLELAFDGSAARLTGEILIPSARIGIPELPEAAVTPSEDVVIVGDTISGREPAVPFGVDIAVRLGDEVTFDGFGLTARLTGGLSVIQPPGEEPRGRGEIQLVSGTFRQLGQELRIDPGRLTFNGPLDDPGIDARAFVRAQDGTEAGFRVGGTVQKLDLQTYSNPPRTESDIMSYILFGRPMTQTSGSEAMQASNAAAVLGANMLAMSLAPSLGLDEARVETGTQQNKAQLVVGKYLSPRLYVGYGIGLYEPISTIRLRYLLSARWSIEAITGDQQSTDLLWRIERGGPKEEPAQAAESAGDEPGPPSEAEELSSR